MGWLNHGDWFRWRSGKLGMVERGNNNCIPGSTTSAKTDTTDNEESQKISHNSDSMVCAIGEKILGINVGLDNEIQGATYNSMKSLPFFAIVSQIFP